MAFKIIPSFTWAPIDVDAICRPWDKAKDGTEVRQKNKVSAVLALVGAINHLLATTVRVLMTACWYYSDRPTSSSDPLVIFWWDDNTKNARKRSTRALCLPRTSGSGDQYMQRTGDTGTYGQKHSYTPSAVYWPQDTYEDRFDYVRGAVPSPSKHSESISTFNNYSPFAITVQESPLEMLDTDLHDYVAGTTAPGDPMLANILEECRAKFHELRTKYLPIVFWWNAYAIGGTWQQPTASTIHALRSAALIPTNLFNNTSTSRGVTTPGMHAHAFRAGRGPETKDVGKKVPVRFGVYAKCEGESGTGYVQFIGPDHVASNTVQITVGGTLTWYEASSNLYLNSDARVGDTTSAQNKVDPMGHQSGASVLFVYAIAGIMAPTL